MDLLSPEAKAFDASEDFGSGLGPAERLGVGVVLVEKAGYGGLEFGDAAMHAAAKLAFGKQCKQALDLVQPGCARGDEMDMPARALGQPVSDQLGLVRGVVTGRR